MTIKNKLRKLEKDFNEIYKQFYDNGENFSDEYCYFNNQTFYANRCAELHDDDAQNDIFYVAVLNLFAKHRGDFIISDRECASFWVAFQFLKK